MHLETPGELADWLADKMGIYGDPNCVNPTGIEGDDMHDDDCNCRVFWVPRMADRIRSAVKNEEALRDIATYRI
jgi:hypothetical protein